MRHLVVTALLLAALTAVAEPKLLFKASFDGTAKAEVARGKTEPLPITRNLSFVPGRHGQALDMRAGMKSLLAYSTDGALDTTRGTVAFWFKPAPGFFDAARSRRMFVGTDTPSPRAGSGALWFWKWRETLRADMSDDGDSYMTTAQQLLRDEWNHVAFTWGVGGVAIFINGRGILGKQVGASLVRNAHQAKSGTTDALQYSRRQAYGRFFVGCDGGGNLMDGAMDDLEVWSEPLNAKAVADMYRAAGGIDRTPKKPDYVAKYADDPPNPYEADTGDGNGVPQGMELVEKVVFDGVPSDPERWNSVGDWHVGHLDGVPYLEASGKVNDRFAYRFKLDESVPLYVFEIDYPDDRKRTVDFIVQGTHETRWDGTTGADYGLQVGVACGDEYPNTGRFLTHRCIYWQRGADVAFCAMTARGNAPAAVREIRLYKIKDAKLPVATVREPKANADGWHRTFALYFEDPAVGYDFGIDGKDEYLVGPMIDRIAATMKYTGQNMLCYPGAWYHGPIGEDGYNPRTHAPAFREAYYAKFDREGLGLMPTLNWQDLRLPSGALTRKMLDDGSVHASKFSVWDNGSVSLGLYHGTPPIINVAHPDVQKEVLDAVDAFIAEGRGHPSFKGLLIHLVHHSFFWFGDICAGYNDYCIEAFSQATGVSVPRSNAPDRGKAYAEWIKANAYENWLDWRCGVVADFYRKIAARLAAARPDLKLVVNTFLLPNWRHPDFGQEHFLIEAYRRAGLDPKLFAGLKNVTFCQTEIPADYRWFGPYDPSNPRDNGRWGAYRPTAEPLHRNLYFKKGDFELIENATFPWVNQHDRYWESACGATPQNACHGQYDRDQTKPRLTCSWLKECPWRVTTINPAGRHALKHYAVPLRYGDVLAMSKGGFLIGTYGSEDVLVPFMRAFRALPAVKFNDVAENGGRITLPFVKVRQKDFDGRSYFYVVNTGDMETEVRMSFPAGTEDLVTGQKMGASGVLTLKAYELRSFSAPSGSPKWR